MQVCPNCGAEYPDGASVCPKCGVKPGFDPALLVSVADGTDAEMAGELLRRAGIPYYEKLREGGEYAKIVLGRSNAFSTGIYVDRADVPRAMETIGFLGSREPFDEQALEDAVEQYEPTPEDRAEQEEQTRRDRGSYRTFLLFLALFGVFIALALALRALT